MNLKATSHRLSKFLNTLLINAVISLKFSIFVLVNKKNGNMYVRELQIQVVEMKKELLKLKVRFFRVIFLQFFKQKATF